MTPTVANACLSSRLPLASPATVSFRSSACTIESTSSKTDFMSSASAKIYRGRRTPPRSGEPKLGDSPWRDWGRIVGRRGATCSVSGAMGVAGSVGPVAEEKRFQVFVSSTYLDLIEARQAVVSTLLGVDAFPAGMELFPAADDDAWTLIEQVIADSDYYLLIIGGKYGSVEPTLEISYTEREYDAAVAMKKPVMAFLHGQPGKLLAEQTEDSDERRALLAAFRAKVEKAKHVKYWTSPEDLAGKVALTWNSFRKRYPAVGWIRADQASSQEQLAALARTQKELDALKVQLELIRTQAPPGTEGLAQGSQSFTLPVYCHGEWWATGYRRSKTGKWTSTVITWDRVFGYLGLRMMQEATSEQLDEDLKDLLRVDFPTEVRAAFYREVRRVATEAEVEDVKRRFDGVLFRDEDFQTLLLQLVALGLIQRSQRNRSVKDTANYWTLTPFGHTRLIQLRALQAGDTSLLRPADEPDPVLEAEAEAQAEEQLEVQDLPRT